MIWVLMDKNSSDMWEKGHSKQWEQHVLRPEDQKKQGMLRTIWLERKMHMGGGEEKRGS